MQKANTTPDSPAVVRRKMFKDLTARGLSKDEVAVMLGYKDIHSMSTALAKDGYPSAKKADLCANLFGYDATYLASGVGSLFPSKDARDAARQHRTDLAMQALGYLISAGYDANDGDALTTLAISLADMITTKIEDTGTHDITYDEIRMAAVSRDGAQAIYLALQVYPGTMVEVAAQTLMGYQTLLPYFSGKILDLYDKGRRTQPRKAVNLFRYLRLDDYLDRYRELPTKDTMPQYLDLVRELGYRPVTEEGKKDNDKAA